MDQKLYQLIREAKQGQKEAFVQLVKQFKNSVFQQAYAMIQDRMEAEDISQEVFLKVYHDLKNLQSPYAFSSWLRKIVFHLSYDRNQKKKKESLVMADGWEERMPSPLMSKGSLEEKDMQLTIEEAMGKLSLDHRTMIVLRDVQGFSYDEIAELLNIPSGTVKSRIHAARLALRKELLGEEDA